MATALSLLGEASARLVALALPPRCPGCAAVTQDDHAFCVTCWQALEFLGEPCCACCGEPLPLAAGEGMRCAACLADPPALDAARAAVAYSPIARRIALRLKYAGRTGLAETIARQLDRIAVPPDALVVPVPLHRWRIWRRGYNQAALIARAVAKRRGLAFAPELLLRTRATPVLRGLNPAERRRAVRGAFALGEGEVTGRRILLIDDVYTTGSTAEACARLLKRAGAAEVRLLCWARVVREVDN